MAQDEIKDEKSLGEWLQSQTREVDVTIAQRAAMRVAPLPWQCVPPVTNDLNLTTTAVARPLLITAVAVTNPEPKIKLVSAAAAYAAADAAYNAHESTTRATDVDAAFYAARAAESAASAAHASRANAAVSGASLAAVHSAADAARAWAAALWEAIRADARALSGEENGQAAMETPLWPGGADPFETERATVLEAWRAEAKTDPAWTFWADWYQAALKGRPLLGDWNRHWALLTDIATKIPNDAWDDGPKEVHPIIADMYEQAKSIEATPLAQAAVVDFTFDKLLAQMRAVGFEDDAAHLCDPERVQSFLDDMAEARDGLIDFADYAGDPRGTTNAPAVLQRSAEKLLAELKRTDDTSHLRARRIVTLAKHLQGFSTEEDKRAEIGPTLAKLLDDQVDLIGDVCRKHLLPSIGVLSALDKLELGDIEPKEFIEKLEGALARIESADGTDLLPLAYPDVVMLKDMLEDLRVVSASIAEGSTDEFIAVQRNRFARGTGELGATVGRYTEQSERARLSRIGEGVEKAGETFDKGVKWYRRWRTLEDVWKWLDWFDKSGGGGAAGM